MRQAIVLICLFLSFSNAHAGLGIQHWVTSNGAKVYYVPSPGLPMVDIEVVFNAGGARDGKAPGVAKLTNALLDQGAGALSADQIAVVMDDVGAQMGNSSLRDMAIVTLRSLTDPDYLKPALKVYADVIQAPTFPVADFKRIKQQMLLIVEKAKESPASIASKAFYKAVYGDHPYGQPAGGTEASLTAITQEQVKAFYQQYYVANNALVAIVGDVDRAQAESIAETVTAKLAKGKAADKLPEAKPLTEAKTIHIDFQSSQSTIVMGQVGMHRQEPDYLPLYIGNHSLGGSGLVAILAEEIREKRGLSYSTYSYFSPMAEKGPFISSLQTKNDQVPEASKVLSETIAKYIETGPTAEQMSASVNNITGGFALRVDSNAKILQYLAMIGFYNMPLDYVDTFITRARAVTHSQIKAALKKHLNPNAMVMVVVGKAAK
ncbi:MAG: insulinase family protein [Methylococcales bacterium]|jgi:zinc protease|nr:insulinase family protein [Methylococcales bacterium]MBT7443025.1 insulinase family protein [Methylococcales bacterium]